jgi:hypothetical protein
MLVYKSLALLIDCAGGVVHDWKQSDNVWGTGDSGSVMNIASKANTLPDIPPDSPLFLPKETQLIPESISRILLVSGLILFLIFSFIDISKPGMEYDECLFFAKAIIDLQNRTIPFVLNSYLGALKEALWMPIALFAIPAEFALRIPSVLIGFLSLLVFHGFLRRAFGSQIANISSFFLSIDPNFIFQIKYDTAPISLALLLRSAVLLAGFLFYKTRARAYLYLSFFIFSLGIYNKITYLNFALIILLPCFLVYFKDIVSIVRDKSMRCLRVIVICGLCFIAGSFPLLYLNVVSEPLCTIRQIIHRSDEFASKTSLTLPQKFKYRTGFMVNSLSGDLFLSELESGATIYSPEYYNRFTYSYFNEAKPPVLLRWLNLQKGNGLPFLTLLAFVSCLFLYVSRRERIYLYIIASMSIWYLSSIILSGAVYSFHILTIYPMLIAYIVFAGIQVALSIRAATIRKLLLWIVFLVFLLSNMGQDLAYTYSIHSGNSKGMWSKAINELSSELMSKYQSKTIYVLDWGIRPQLIILSRNTLKLQADLDATERRDIDKILDAKESIFLMHTPKYSKFAERRDDFFRFIKDRQVKIDKLSEIKQENGEVLFEIYGRK